MPPAVRRAIAAHARAERPAECCGFLIGQPGQVLHAMPMANVATTPRTRYRISDQSHIDVRRLLRPLRPRLDIVGVYHSHPAGGADPSPTDVAEAHYTGWIHIIVGLGGGRMRLGAFRIDRGRARRLRVIA